jgi:hypothetical protein
MTLAQSPWRWFADELRRRDDEKSVAQLERTAVLAIKELLDRGEFDVVLVCAKCLRLGFDEWSKA